MSAYTILSSKCKETEQYIEFFRAALTPEYTIQYSQLGGLVLIVGYRSMVRIDLIAQMPTGANTTNKNKQFKNKGGIACFVSCANTRYLFVGCHLAASRKASGAQKRNANLKKILNMPIEGLEPQTCDILENQ